ncbi:MAG TPA: hypothetical protein DCE23_04400 [Firmicutes bacterium]|nr:hypothetical protein [Bacillota bacterium]
MANSIELFKKNAPELLDKVYQQISTTSDFDIDGDLVKAGANANEIVVPILEMDGLADYDRNSGYIDGDVRLTNETVKYNYERGRKLRTDTIDNEETGGVILANLSSEFVRTKVVPEVDAVRYAKYSSLENITDVAEEGIEYKTGDEVLKALEDAMVELDNAEVPEEDRHLRISPTLLSLAEFVSRTTNNDILKRFASIKKVAKKRFQTKIELLSGKDSDGERIGGYILVDDTYKLTTDTSVVDGKVYFTKSGDKYIKVDNPIDSNITNYYEIDKVGSRDINFMIIHKPALLQYTKHAKMKIFTPEEDQDGDDYKMNYRLYGLNDSYVNKRAGIAVSHK